MARDDFAEMLVEKTAVPRARERVLERDLGEFFVGGRQLEPRLEVLLAHDDRERDQRERDHRRAQHQELQRPERLVREASRHAQGRTSENEIDDADGEERLAQAPGNQRHHHEQQHDGAEQGRGENAVAMGEEHEGEPAHREQHHSEKVEDLDVGDRSGGNRDVQGEQRQHAEGVRVRRAEAQGVVEQRESRHQQHRQYAQDENALPRFPAHHGARIARQLVCAEIGGGPHGAQGFHW